MQRKSECIAGSREFFVLQWTNHKAGTGPLSDGQKFSAFSFLTSELTVILVPPEMAFFLYPKVVTRVMSLYMLKPEQRTRSTRDHFLLPSGSLAWNVIKTRK